MPESMKTIKHLDYGKTLQTTKAILQYVSGGYLGDHDVFSHLLKLESGGRDMTAECSSDSYLFMMDLDCLERIKFNFHPIYKQMQSQGIKKYKLHYVNIAKCISDFLREQQNELHTKSFSDIESSLDDFAMLEKSVSFESFVSWKTDEYE